MRQLVKYFNSVTPWPPIPPGPLVAVADAMFEWMGHRPYTLYVVLLKTPTADQAVLTCPILLPGKERLVGGWDVVFNRLPQEVKNRIVALVCDGHTGLIALAHHYHWKIQRCHVHLRLRVENYATTGRFNRSGGVGTELQQLIGPILLSHDEQMVADGMRILQERLKSIQSNALRHVISGFLKHHQDYRTYIQQPTLHLPSTTNAIESLNSLARELQHLARGFRTPESLLSWMEAFMKYKKVVTCRGTKNQPN